MKHGGYKTRIYSAWRGMFQRCRAKAPHKDFYNYVQKGIRVCEEWEKSFESFRDWANRSGYRDGLSLDRIDGNGNYCPENCRFITLAEQSRNRSFFKLSSDFIEKAKSMRLAGMRQREIAVALGVAQASISRALSKGN